jgi:hypothetical protein
MQMGPGGLEWRQRPRAPRQAFTASMSTTFTVGALGILAAALPAFLVMSGRISPKVGDPATRHIRIRLTG